MGKKNVIAIGRILVVLMFLVVIFTLGIVAPGSVSSGDYPYPPPSVLPTQFITPTPSIVSVPSIPSNQSSWTKYPPLPEDQFALNAIFQEYNQPLDQLVIVNRHQVDYLNLSRSFLAYKLISTKAQKWFELIVDRQSHEVIEDIPSIQQAEDRAAYLKYGILEPRLYDRLQSASKDELIPIAIWISGDVTKIGSDVINNLSTVFPEIKVAIDQSRKFSDINNSERRSIIEQAYIAQLTEKVKVLTQPVVNELQARGYNVTSFNGMPSISASLPKQVILELENRPDISKIYLLGGHVVPLTMNAIPTDHVPPLWSLNLKGTNINIAIIDDGNVDFQDHPSSTYCGTGTNNCFAHGYQSDYYGFQGATNHATLTGSIVASNNKGYTGVAPDSNIISVGIRGDSEIEFVNSLVHALSGLGSQNADVVNLSVGENTGRDMTWLDMAFDYYSRISNRLVVVASGDSSLCGGQYYLCSPAKGWNLLSVGAYNDSTNTDWSDDTMGTDSSYINPVVPNGHNDREKPEVVAPGVSLTGIGLNGNLQSGTYGTGTSFAAPQVSGLAALLIEDNSQLRIWPEALRAIIMASAVHNIEGPTGITQGSDFKDGVGGIVADVAEPIARLRGSPNDQGSPCNGPCWWAETISPTTFPAGTYRYYYFNAQAGDHIRAAISWDSMIVCTGQGAACNNGNSPTLGEDFDITNVQLYQNPNSSNLGNSYSASYDNNYELAPENGDLIIPQNGLYRIEVKNASLNWTDSQNYLAVAWTKVPTTTVFLPDLRNANGFTSELFIRNDSNITQSIGIKYYRSDASVYHEICINIAVNAVCDIPITANEVPNGEYASAIIGGFLDDNNGNDNGPISVTVKQHQTGTYEAWDTYTGVEQPINSAVIPLLQKNNSSIYSDIFIQNASPTSNIVTINFYPSISGTSCTNNQYSVGPYGSLWLQMANIGCVGSSFVGSANITANQPIAVTATQYRQTSSFYYTETQYSSNASGTVYAPLIQNNNGSWVSGHSMQNASPITQSINFTFRGGTGSICFTKPLYTNISPFFSVIDNVLPGTICPTIPSASISGSGSYPGGYPVAATINQNKTGTNLRSSYPAIAYPKAKVIFPLWYSQWNGWSTAVEVQNLDPYNPHVITVSFYGQNGAYYNWVNSPNLAAYQNYTFIGIPSGSFIGSAVLTSSGPFVAIANHQIANTTYDSLGSQSGAYR